MNDILITSIISILSGLLVIMITPYFAQMYIDYYKFVNDRESSLKEIVDLYDTTYVGIYRQKHSEGMAIIQEIKILVDGEYNIIELFNKYINNAPRSKLWRLINYHRCNCEYFYMTCESIINKIENHLNFDSNLEINRSTLIKRYVIRYYNSFSTASL